MKKIILIGVVLLIILGSTIDKSDACGRLRTRIRAWISTRPVTRLVTRQVIRQPLQGSVTWEPASVAVDVENFLEQQEETGTSLPPIPSPQLSGPETDTYVLPVPPSAVELPKSSCPNGNCSNRSSYNTRYLPRLRIFGRR